MNGNSDPFSQYDLADLRSHINLRSSEYRVIYNSPRNFQTRLPSNQDRNSWKELSSTCKVGQSLQCLSLYWHAPVRRDHPGYRTAEVGIPGGTYGSPWEDPLEQCFSTFVRPRPGKFFFYKTRARGPTNLLLNNFPFFLSLYIKLP
jgi:hypothetical protein